MTRFSSQPARCILCAIIGGLSLAAILGALAPQSSHAQEAKLIPRSVLFGNPQRASARVSPNGKWLSYLAPVDGILNVFVAPIDDLDAAKQVTDDKTRDIRGYSWAFTGEHILYTQDKAGDENWHVYATNVATIETTDLTPVDGVHARIEGASEKFPTEILVGLNDRNPQLHDIYKVNILTGKRELLQENPGVVGFVTDDDFDVRFAVTFTPQAEQVMLKPTTGDDGEQGWDEFLKIGPDDSTTTGPAGFDKSGDVLYFLDSRDRNTGALYAWNLKTNEKTLLAEDDKADVGEIIAHPTKHTIQAVGFTYSRREWQILDDDIRADLEYLETVEDGELIVTSRTLADDKWTVAYILDDGPLKFYLYDRPAKQAKFLFNSRDDMQGYDFVKMHTPVITSRDGLPLVSYLSLPPGSDPDGDGVPDAAVPMVLDVHGGPWARDDWGYNPYHQWLANRGYAVLSVNYRGSTGFGKDFVNAANGEWAGKMHDDLLDAVNWAVDQGIAQRDKVCIMGGSYGGYATLVGMTFTPDTFACGVDIVGPSSLVTLLQNIPPYWMPIMPLMNLRMGDVSTEEGRAELLKRSPLTLVDKIQRPLLIGQGANDPRVTQLEADQIVEAMQAKKIPVTYVLYPDEGHGFALEENRMSFNAVTEAFLAEHLGGRFEPVGAAFEDSSIHVPAGADGVPGVAEALPADRLEMPAEELADPAATN
ncbi:MAG: S9 family peptidase [Planctomycetaceae bacterium]|nr:S9 family peptidase [Planctomycetaceae bacterium]